MEFLREHSFNLTAQLYSVQGDKLEDAENYFWIQF